MQRANMVLERRNGCPRGGESLQFDAPQSGSIGRAAGRRSYVVLVVGVALIICATCQSVGDWLLAPQLAILAGLLWHTRHDVYAALPGFGIAFVAGVIMRGGIGPAAEIDCGLYSGVIGAPINAICRGFCRGGAVALVAIFAYFGIVQATLLLVFR